MAAKVDESKCAGCGICVQACPVEAITVDRVAKIDADTCMDCGSCKTVCPNDAIFMGGMETASSFRRHAPPPSHISTTRAATSPIPPRIFGKQPGFQKINRSGGLLGQIFDFFGRSGGQGGRRGKGCGGRRGRGNRRRFPIS
jgi:NAD-dependent dihydropyrimidine dehydrogenase PreA subunit